MKSQRHVAHMFFWLAAIAIFQQGSLADIHVVVTKSGVPVPYVVDGPNVSIPQDLEDDNYPEITSDTSMIRIYTDAPGTEDIGHVIITATRASSNPLVVFISTQPALPVDPTDEIQNGVQNWFGGLACSSDCEAAVRLVAGVGGSITGAVRAGQIYVLQAKTGIISADATASNADGVPQAGFAISRIVADAISGDVEAERGTIGEIEAELSSLSGVTGNVLAPEGAIQFILSESEIGQQSPATPVRIEAKIGIGSIVAKAINADIKADVNNGTGGIRLLRTQTAVTGHLRGSLRAKGLLADGALAGGIEVRGSQFAPIEISGSVNRPIRI